MPSLRDLIPAVREVGPFAFVARIWRETLDDHVFVYASALSYAWLFAFFPMLIFLLSLIPFLPEQARDTGQRLVFDAIRLNFPGAAAEQILESPKLQSVLDSALNQRRGTVLSVSLIIALWAASNGISAVMTALDRCYDIEHGRPFYTSKPISLLLTVVLTTLALLVMTLIPVGSFVRDRLVSADYRIPLTDVEVSQWTVTLFDISRYFVGFTAGFLMLSLIYNFCPSVRMKWRLVTPGAVFCFIAWVAIGLGFRTYLQLTGGTSYAQTFGPAAGLAVLLLMFYLYGVVLLIGAEINSEIDFIRLKAPPGTRDLRPFEREISGKRR
jgi:membrane protein